MASLDLNSTIEVQFPVNNEKNEKPCLLTRCTSTPVNSRNVFSILADQVSTVSFLSPPSAPSLDSGFESDLSHRSTPIVTRSRSRQWSGPSIDLKKYPKTDKFGDDSSCKKSIIYRPGIFTHLEFFDIIRRLHDRNTRHILSHIFKHLSPEDLAKCLQVSTSWNIAIILDRDAVGRYAIAKELSMDQNKTFKTKHICSRLKNGGPRKALTSVSNVILSPVKPKEQRRSPRLASSPNHKRTNKLLAQIVSPSKVRHKLFADVSINVFLIIILFVKRKSRLKLRY